VSKPVTRARRGATRNTLPPSPTEEPTAAQLEWLAEVESLLARADELERDGRRLHHARRELPEVQLLRFLVFSLRQSLVLGHRARVEGRSLEMVHPSIYEAGDQTPALRLGPAGARVIHLAPHLARRSRHG
jgi:hypothetical protein